MSTLRYPKCLYTVTFVQVLVQKILKTVRTVSDDIFSNAESRPLFASMSKSTKPPKVSKSAAFIMASPIMSTLPEMLLFIVVVQVEDQRMLKTVRTVSEDMFSRAESRPLFASMSESTKPPKLSKSSSFIMASPIISTLSEMCSRSSGSGEAVTDVGAARGDNTDGPKEIDFRTGFVSIESRASGFPSFSEAVAVIVLVLSEFKSATFFSALVCLAWRDGSKPDFLLTLLLGGFGGGFCWNCGLDG